MNNARRHPIAIMGLPLSSLTADQAVASIDELLQQGGTHLVCPVNLDVWLNGLGDPHLHRIMSGASLVLADGMPLVWTSKLMGAPLAERVTGVDLVPRLAALSARKGYRIFLLGGREGVVERAAEVLRRTCPGVNVVGTHAPAEADLSRMDHAGILGRIQDARPDILLVAFGNPKQEKWIWMHRKKLGVGVAMGVGGSFDILVGDTRRAPRWIQRSGFEWAMRFVQEPRRLGPRYFRDFLGLCSHLPFALAGAWLQRPCKGPSRVTHALAPQVMHLYIHGKLADNIADAADAAIATCLRQGLVLVVHLRNARQITAYGMGILMDARRQLLEAGLTISLAGLSLRSRFLLRAWCLHPLFDEWHPVMHRGRSLVRAEGLHGLEAGMNPDTEAIPAQSRWNG